jgi:hypothetical protein
MNIEFTSSIQTDGNLFVNCVRRITNVRVRDSLKI